MIFIGAGTETQGSSLMTSLQPCIQSFSSQLTPPHQLPPLRSTSLALQIIKNKLWWEFGYVWNCLFFFFFSNYYKTWKMFSTKNILSMSLLWRNVMLFWKNGKDEVTYVMFGTGRIGGRGFHHSLSRKV